jgi:nitrate reductase gamma subunit
MPFFVPIIEKADGFFQFYLPVVYQSGLLLGAALTFLLLRRLLDPKVRYISLPADYFPLFLILAIAKTGILMRYVFKVDVVGIKELTMGLITGSACFSTSIYSWSACSLCTFLSVS